MGIPAVDALMGKADRACLSSRILFEAGDLDGACNRAYYAMFDAARAALLASGGDADGAKTHSGVITAFGLNLVKNGPIARELGKVLKRAEEIRLVADYKDDSIWPEDAAEMIAQAEAFIAGVKSFLSKLES